MTGIPIAMSLVRQARAGDMAAFEQLMRRHERLVLMTALRLLNGNMADAQDAAQTVFLRMHRHLGTFREDGDLAHWLYRITANVCHDMQRGVKKRGEIALDPLADIQDGSRGQDDVLDDATQGRILTAGLAKLPEKERAAIVLRDIEGLATREVAEILGSSEATVRSQISSGREKIRKFAERYMRRRS